MGYTQDIVVRQARPDDAHALAHLHAKSWRQTYRGQLTDAFLDGPILEDRLDLWCTRLANPSSRQGIWVATRAGAVVGLACAYAQHDEQWGTLLENLHVAHEHKRQGIGQRLFETVRQWATHSAQAEWLHLWVLAGNHTAQRFYQGLNALHKESGTWHAPDGSSLAQLRYVWPLKPLQQVSQCDRARTPNAITHGATP
ncbi:MAG: GNAT family N-acetyltransferase [Aquabacterium sp.]|uniref:GNAT family N-acetyltransferase n=1 Tax=Aquabacterium sp. TaxID=1872578 RepID=UPI0011F728C5|nr:GNAT family N-acetyltransferase [Aquabacterium sp.]TAK99337.1 MAG: GNAT family N-acetyltransferase [Aquabacterium sp.]